MADLEARSIGNRNKLLVEAMTAKMEQVMSRKLDAFRQELQRHSGQEQSRARRRKEQELKPKPPDDTSRSTRSSPHKTSHTPKSKFNSYSDFQPTKELQPCKFSGKGNYVEWEQSIDDWFDCNHVLKDKRLAYAMDRLIGDAYKWWLQEVYDRWYYNKPTITAWRELRKLMRDKYAPKGSIPKEAYSPQPKKVPKHVLNEKTDHEDLVMTKPCPTPTDGVSNITIFKAENVTNVFHGTKVSLAYEFIQYWNNVTYTRSIKQPVLHVEISSIMHLILPLRAKEDTGTLHVCNGLKRTTTTWSLKMDQKEKPPAASSPIKNRGNYLDSQKRMKPNLLSLGADCTILSSNPSQGRKINMGPLPPYEVYLDEILLKGKQGGKKANFFARAGHVKNAEYFDPKLFVSLDKLSCETNLAPVPPSELNKFLQDVSLPNDPWKLQFDHSYLYNVALFYDGNIHTKPKRIGEGNRDKACGKIKARDKQLSEVVKLQAKLSIEATTLCLHQDTSQNHIWRPGDYLERSRHMPHEIWISSLHMIPMESKMNISSFGSFQTYHWRPGEFLDTSIKDELVTNNALIQEEPPDPTPLSLTEMSIEHTKDFIQVSHSLSHCVSHDLWTVCMSLIYPEIIENELGLVKELSEQNFCLKTKKKYKRDKDNALAQNEISLVVYGDSMTVLIHLLFAKGVENIAGIKEEPPDLEDLSSNVFERTGIGVLLTKELNSFQRSILVEMTKRNGRGFCDAESLLKSHDNINQPLDIRDLRTNPFQEGEDDMILDSIKNMEHGLEREPEEAKRESKDTLGAEEIFATPAGPITRSRTKGLSHVIGALLRPALAQEEHSDLACFKTTLVMIHVREG